MALSTDRGIQIRHLLLGNVLDLFRGHLATLSLLGAPDPLAIPAARFNKIEAGGRLGNECERAVAIDRDHHRDDQPFEFLLRRPRG